MKSIFKEFIANFKHFKSAYILNILGLAIAIAAFIGIVLQLAFEMNYDKFRPNAESIYRVECYNESDKGYSGSSYSPLGEVLKDRCPEITDYFVINSGGESIYIIKNNQGESEKYKEASQEASSPAIIDMLSFDIIEGDGRKAFLEPNMLLIPESVAHKWFGEKSPIQQQVVVTGQENYNISFFSKPQTFTICAVYKDFPTNSIFRNCCYSQLPFMPNLTWNALYLETFLQVSTKNTENVLKKMNSIKIEEIDWNKHDQPFRLTELTDLYFKDTTPDPTHKTGNIINSLLLFAIAFIIIIIATINFINFSISQAPTRIRKINTHRILGANNLTLRIKLISENLIYWFIAFLLALFILQLFSGISDNLLLVSIAPLNNISILGYYLILILLFGIISGIYPAWYCTSFPPSVIIKGNFILTPQGKKIRNIFLVFQISTSILLSILTIVIILQNNYLLKDNIGIPTTDIAYFRTSRTVLSQHNSLVNELKQIPEITGYTFTNWIPGVATHIRQNVVIGDESFESGHCCVDHNFTTFFNVPIIEGKDFSELVTSPRPQVIFSESMLKKHSSLKNYLGKNINVGTFIGVTKDIRTTSLHEHLTGVYFLRSIDFSNYYYMFVKIAGKNKQQTVGRIKKIFDKISPNDLFNIQFLDKAIQQQYEEEKKLSKLVTILSSIAFILALLGVYSLIIFNTQYKRQEIAIRKINGATENEIIIWLNKGFVRLVIIAFLISCPITYWMCKMWLESFIYKTPIYWWIFFIAGLSTLLLVIITVSRESWKAASINPVESLKNE